MSFVPFAEHPPNPWSKLALPMLSGAALFESIPMPPFTPGPPPERVVPEDAIWTEQMFPIQTAKPPFVEPFDAQGWAREEVSQILAEVMVRELPEPEPDPAHDPAGWARDELAKILTASNIITVSDLFPEEPKRPSPRTRKRVEKIAVSREVPA